DPLQEGPSGADTQSAVFVEIARLIIVLVCTAAGLVIARGSGSAAGGMAVLGATLGACAGYVIGGVFARLLRRAMGHVERQVSRAPAAHLLGGALGAGILGLFSALLGVPAV